MRIAIASVVALGLLVSACSPAATETSVAATGTQAPTTTTTSTTVPPTTTSAPATSTTTTLPPGDVSPINGLEVEDEALMNRRVLAVKIDNHPRANPQSGIDQADMVIELMVEGITRFISVWLQSDAEYLGPIRSARPTDPTLLRAFNEPTFAISGAQQWVQILVRSKDVRLIGEVRPAMFRISSRKAPHNLYGDTNLIREYADQLGYPDEPPTEPIWSFGPVPEDAAVATSVRIDFLGQIVRWTWDEESGLYLRTAYNRESTYRNEDGTEGRVGVPVLVALYVEQYTAYPPAGQSGTPLPASRTLGSGKAFVFANGKVVEGTWTRGSEDEWFRLTYPNGEELSVPPGKVWVSLVPVTRGLTYSD
ncbi:MAG: DUF3048 domain-containing protein [Acidimicrobiia bacterium]